MACPPVFFKYDSKNAMLSSSCLIGALISTDGTVLVPPNLFNSAADWVSQRQSRTNLLKD